jgi:hypothetical protein
MINAVMQIRRTLVLGVVVAGLAGGAGASAQVGPFAGAWSHAQINVVGRDGRPHTLIYDRGRVTAVTPSSLTLRELDGSVVTIQVAPNAVVRLNGGIASLSDIRPGFQAMTLGRDGAPARLVRATVPPRLRARGAGTGSSSP